MRKVFAGMLLTVLAAAGAEAQSLPTVNQILEKYVTALGGRAAMQKLNSRISSGTIEFPEQGASGTVVFYAKAPNKRRYTVEVEGFGRVEQGFDGATGWSSSPQNGVATMDEGELAYVRIAADFHNSLRIGQAYSDLKVRGREKVGESDAYVVEGKQSDGKLQAFFFDVASGLLVRSVSQRATPEGDIQIDTHLSDYREVDGVKLAHLIQQQNAGVGSITRLNAVKHNVVIEDSLFARPSP